MNQEITIDDYKSIGTMETALSEHADEAFFELSPERQKTAEKIFKCLTETDGENREIRRATTIEKLCAIAEAEFSEVASVIEVFRKDGRTFLMPPPDVELNERSLIDISHESLIRKWERLKHWVEEEGQSSRTYRRLAEDALLHKQGKMGFWSDPELKDALEWREGFKPNETWAQLYKETGERQYKASFADAMQYLDESEINRDEEIAEDTRQQNALKSYAAKLRWLVVGLVILLLASFGVVVYAFIQRAETVRINEKLETEKKVTEAALVRLEESRANLKRETEEKDRAFTKLETSLKEQEAATKRAEDEKKRADDQTEQAKLSEAEKTKALESQKRLSKEAEDAKNNAIEKQIIAENAKKRAELLLSRDVSNRVGLLYLDRGETSRALQEFTNLLDSYKNDSELDKAGKAEGEWWALHNLGNVYSKSELFEKAEHSYLEALEILEAPSNQKSQLQNSENVYFQPVSYQTDTGFTLGKTATLRRLALLYRTEAYKEVMGDDDWERLLRQATDRYNQLLSILEKEYGNGKQSNPPADVYVELADCLAALGSYDKAQEYYAKAIEVYNKENYLVNLVGALKQSADAAIAQKDGDKAVEQINKAIDIQENKMDLSPVNLEIADSYDLLAKADELSVQGDSYRPPPYGELFGLIRRLNYAADRTDYIDLNDVVKLADTYIAVGKCHRAEKVYFYALDRSNQSSEQGKYLREFFVYLHFTIGLAEIYQNVLPDEVKAQKYYNEFYETLLKRTADSYEIDEKLYTKAGDYYFAKGDYERAGRIYETALRQLEDKDGKFDLDNAYDSADREHIIDLINTKSEFIVRVARVLEKQNKLPEAEAEYLAAVNFLTKKFGETDALTAKALVYQADFYERHQNPQKAQEIYIKAKNILTNPAILTGGKTQTNSAVSTAAVGLDVRVLKKLGDISRSDVKNAADFYRQAYSIIVAYGYKSSMFQSNNPEPDSRYFLKGELTVEYYIDKTEVLEAWSSLKTDDFTDELKGELENAQLLSKAFTKPVCEEDEP